MVAKFIPFLLLGLALVTFFFGLILFAYLFIFGAIVGFVLFVISWIRATFFPSKHLMKRESSHESSPRQGRTFDHEDQDH